MLTGWEGSATDAHVYDDAITSDLHIPEEKYLLADAGYPLRRQLLVPYRGVLQTHINFPIFFPIFPDFLERLSHLAPIY
jgi:hypothetical protein